MPRPILNGAGLSFIFSGTRILTQSLRTVDGGTTKITLREEGRCFELVPFLSGEGVDGLLANTSALGQLLVLADS